jgi:uncharacterized protein
MTTVQNAAVADPDRLQALDLIRGAAVLGILIVNMQLFSMPDALSVNPFALGQPSNSDLTIWSVIQVLAESKFMTIFSMLFGAGIVLMTSRVERRGANPGRLHYRRMFWLLIFGLLHAYLLWHGDILVFYAVCGMLVYAARRLQPRALAALGIVMLAIGTSISGAFGLTWASLPDEARTEWQSYWQPAASAVGAERAAFRGSWVEQERQRVRMSLDTHLGDIVAWGIWRAGGLMVLGMALLKLDILTGRRSRRYYVTLAAVGLATGLPLVAWGLREFFAHRSSLPDSVFLVPLWNYWGSILVALGYIGVLMTMWTSGVMPGLIARLSSVGKTAFSCYILETVICTTIFYGHGLGWFGGVDRLQQLLLTFAVWVALLLLAPLWLRRFQYGPLEWLWRRLTYGTVMPSPAGSEPAHVR